MYMHEALVDAQTHLKIELPNLEKAAKLSTDEVAKARHFFKEHLGWGDQLDIVVCGSMARHEMSGASDFDYLIVAHGLVEDATKTRAFRRACDDWCDLRSVDRPGPTGIFGKVISATELVEQIGLEFDTNRSLTRRVLMIEEGVSVLAPKLHRRLVTVVLSRYLDGPPVSETSVPRFLLNDMTRYWRTIAVDYQAKVWDRLDYSGWGLRYLKLRISRKLTFAGSLVPPLLVAVRSPSDSHQFLVEQYVDLPPLARLAQLTVDLRSDAVATKALRGILEIADAFAGFLADPQARQEARDIGVINMVDEQDSTFARMRKRSGELQQHLECLFLDSPTLGSLGRKYMTF